MSYGALVVTVLFLFVLISNVHDATETLALQRDAAQKHAREVDEDVRDLRRQVAAFQEEMRELEKDSQAAVYFDSKVTFQDCVVDKDTKSCTCRLER